MPEANNDTATTATPRGASKKALAILAVVAVFVYGIDQLSKFLIVSNLTVGEIVPVIGELFQLHFVKNPGAAFSLGSGTTWIFAIIAATVVVVIILFARRIRSLGWAVLLGLLLGGNLGNLTDRLTREPGFGVGHVIDFLQIYAFPAIFNVADVAIVFSMVVFVILTIRGTRLNGTRVEPAPKKGAAPEDQSKAEQPQLDQSQTEQSQTEQPPMEKA